MWYPNILDNIPYNQNKKTLLTFPKSRTSLYRLYKIHSLTITNDSNLIQVPTHDITQDKTDNQNTDNTLSTIQDNTSILFTSHANVSQPSQTQRSPRQNYDPPSIPPQFSTQIHTHNSPQ